jgi:hypothetical protein
LVAALGLNVTEIEQEAQAARLAGQLLVYMYTPGPASEIISINTGSPGCFFLPLGLDTLTVFGLLGVPTVVFENLSDFGFILSVTATGVGVHVSDDAGSHKNAKSPESGNRPVFHRNAGESVRINSNWCGGNHEKTKAKSQFDGFQSGAGRRARRSLFLM